MFIAYEVSVQLIHSLRDLVPKIQKFDRNLADQMQRAATSVTLNLAEGQRLRAGNQRNHYEIAHGSANEVKAALDLAEAWAGSPTPKRHGRSSIVSSRCCGG